jgi:phosphoribosyl-ATP pyrophosphohydrolase
MFDNLKFDRDGLIPAIVQDYFSKEVLTLAYMNRESLQISIDESRTCFYSRSRKQLWRKGETSGNTQQIVSITVDCDGDALTVEVIKAGPACHTGAQSCFGETIFQSPDQPAFSVDALYQLIQGRKAGDKEGSYTTYLFQKGIDKILKKVGEEATETIIAAKADDKAETIYEISDLMYHVLVLMAQMDIAPADILAQLASRHVIDKKVKQEKMT